jgi:hypothetical protein
MRAPHAKRPRHLVVGEKGRDPLKVVRPNTAHGLEPTLGQTREPSRRRAAHRPWGTVHAAAGGAGGARVAGVVRAGAAAEEGVAEERVAEERVAEERVAELVGDELVVEVKEEGPREVEPQRPQRGADGKAVFEADGRGVGADGGGVGSDGRAAARRGPHEPRGADGEATVGRGGGHVHGQGGVGRHQPRVDPDVQAAPTDQHLRSGKKEKGRG